jgi:hypothetical protein
MPKHLTPELDEALSQLAGRFAHWRRTRASRQERIPDALWAEAVALTQTLPVGRVARRCRLSPSDLKARCHTHPPALSTLPSPAFVELPVAQMSPPPADERMLVELERPDGARMRLRYHHTPPPLSQLVSAFLEGQ